MGWFDFLRSKRDPMRAAAERIDLEAGVLERCPVCHEIVDKQRDDLLDTADRRAAQLVAESDPLVQSFRGDLDRLKRLLREVRAPRAFNCRCEAGD